ncbi:hypothetical protein ALC62_12326, partial [Cyphomyrmex costatus]
CLHYFSSSAKLELHSVDCGKLNDCAIRLPSEDDKKERVPFVVYADLECALEKMDKEPASSMYTHRQKCCPSTFGARRYTLVPSAHVRVTGSAEEAWSAEGESSGARSDILSLAQGARSREKA